MNDKKIKHLIKVSTNRRYREDMLTDAQYMAVRNLIDWDEVSRENLEKAADIIGVSINDWYLNEALFKYIFPDSFEIATDEWSPPAPRPGFEWWYEWLDLPLDTTEKGE